MPLILQPAEDTDALRAAVIEHDAYAVSQFNSIFFPGPFPPNILEIRAQEMLKHRKEDETAIWLKVVDTDIEPTEDNAQMIAFAKWNIYERAPKAKPIRDWPPGVNAEACNAFFGPLSTMKDRMMGERSYVFLHILVTDPKSQGRGAGTMLMNWGLEEAKKRAFPVYLESSDMGHSLYTKAGFRDLELFAVDMSKWGATELCKTWAMIREAQ